MGSRGDLIKALAPVAPPCFSTRLQWVAYLTSAAEAQKETRPSASKDPRAVVLVIENGSARINPDFAFCRDCSAKHSFDMHRAGKCKPKHLMDVLAEAQAGA